MTNEPKDWELVRTKIMQRHSLDGDCWEWKSFFTHGRPVLHFQSTTGKHTCAPTRMLVAILWGKHVAPNHKCVPVCGNSKCVNPDHIRVIPLREHLRRASKVAHSEGNEILRAAKIAEVRRAKHAKLTWDQVNAIRESDQPYRTLSAEYGVSMALIGRIKRNEAWVQHIAKANPFAALMR